MLVTRGLGRPSAGLAAAGLARWATGTTPQAVHPVSIVPGEAAGIPALYLTVRNAQVRLESASAVQLATVTLVVAVTSDHPAVRIDSLPGDTHITVPAAGSLVLTTDPQVAVPVSTSVQVAGNAAAVRLDVHGYVADVPDTAAAVAVTDPRLVVIH